MWGKRSSSGVNDGMNMDSEPELPEFQFREPTQEEFLEELRALGIDVEDEPHDPALLPAAEEREFGMLRTVPVELGDYNVDNMELTAEDEHNPELLAELELLQHKGVPEPDKTPEQPVLEEIPETSSESACPIVELPQVEASSLLSQISVGSASLDELKQMALAAKRSGDLENARQLMKEIMALQTPAAAAPSLTQEKAIDLGRQIKDFTNQAAECKQAAKILLSRGDKSGAAKFLRQEKAFTEDLLALRNAKLQGDKLTRHLDSVIMGIPVDMTNPDVPMGEIHLVLRDIKVEPRKFAPKSSKTPEKYIINAIIGFPTGKEAQPPPVKTTPAFAFGNFTGERLAWTGVVPGDLKILKYFEHHKLRLELCRIETSGSFFFKTSAKPVHVGQATLRTAPLVSERTIEETVEFLDSSRKQIGVSIRATIAMNRPLSLKIPVVGEKKVTWAILREGETGKLFSQATPGPSPLVQEETEDDEVKAAESFAERISSYVVLEYEVGKLKSNPASATDPALLARLMALESKLEQLMMSVDIGKLSIEQYLEQLRHSIPRAKRSALEAKRAGRLEEARNWLHHANLMEDEIRGAEAAEGGEC